MYEIEKRSRKQECNSQLDMRKAASDGHGSSKAQQIVKPWYISDLL